MNISEAAHIVNILPPVDISGGVDCDVFTMAGHAHASIILSIGVSAAAFTKIIVNKCSSFAAGNPVAIAHSIYKCETDASDVLGAKVAVLAAGTTPSANNNIFYVIELDSAELDADHPFVQVQLTNEANSVIASAVAILTGGTHATASSPTVIA